MNHTMKPLLPVLVLIASACGASNGTEPSASLAFQGQWAGQHVATSCTPATSFFCTALPATPAPLTLTVTQTANSASGTLTLGSIVIPVSGAVTGGTLNLSGGPITVQNLGTERLVSWSSTVSGSSMAGSFSWAIDGGPVTATVSSALQGVVKQ